LDRRLGGPQIRSGRSGEEKNSQTLPEPEHPNIEPVAQRYTDWAIPALRLEWILGILEGKCGLNASTSGKGPVPGFYVQGNESSGSIKGWEFD
jgi:hypothetical protein